MIENNLRYHGHRQRALRAARLPRSSVLLVALGVSACSVGPHLTMPTAGVPASYTAGRPDGLGDAGTAQPAITWTTHANDVWWQMFHSRQLDGLIAASLRNSPTLAAARDALTAANEYAVAQEGALFPTIGLGGGLQRNTSLRSIVGGRVVVPGKPFTLSSASAQISYNADVFGLTTDLYRNARQRAKVSAAAVQQAKIFLAGNVATAGISLAGYQAELGLRRKIVGAETSILTVMESDYRLGSITDESVEQQKSVLAASKASIPLLTAERDNARHRLDYLTGNPPNRPVARLRMADLALPKAVPIVVPSALVENRPDIVAAMARVKAASAAVDASTAAMYPSSSISATFGAGSPVALFNPASEIWSLASSFAAPLFEGGKLAANKRAAYALWQQATSQYRNTTFRAFRQVADSLRRLQGAEASLQQRQAAAQFALSALRLARERYDAGAIPYQTLLNAELQAQTNQIAKLTEQVTSYQDLVTLFVAMGGEAPISHGSPTASIVTQRAMRRT
ncbi:MAG: efflux transporter outer membrane subunit [Acidiphilium sp.]